MISSTHVSIFNKAVTFQVTPRPKGAHMMKRHGGTVHSVDRTAAEQIDELREMYEQVMHLPDGVFDAEVAVEGGVFDSTGVTRERLVAKLHRAAAELHDQLEREKLGQAVLTA